MIGSPEMEKSDTSLTTGEPPSKRATSLLTGQKHYRASRCTFSLALSTFVGLAWLGPAIFLVIWNINGHVIGGSAWCPVGSCGAILLEDQGNGTSQLVSEYDVRGRDLLGGLQYAAKFLEVWFVFTAASLLYTVASLIAKSREGLPIGFLFSFVEFSDPRSLLSPTLWFSAKKPKYGKPQTLETSWKSWKNWRPRNHWRSRIFFILAFCLCALCGFMGPSLAILILPYLDYYQSPAIPQQQIQQLLSAQPPTFISGCNAEELLAQNYTCAFAGPGQTLEAFAANSLSTYNWFQDDLADRVPPYLPSGIPERDLQFFINFTIPNADAGETLTWSPLRQVVDDLDTIYNGIFPHSDEVADTDFTPQTPAVLDALNSLELYVQRQAPVIGTSVDISYANLSTTTIVSDDQQIRCYEYVDPIGTECHRILPGWNGASSIYSFSISANPEDPSSEVVVEVYNTPEVLFINGTFADRDSACFPNGTLSNSTNCDFDQIFSGNAFIDSEYSDPNQNLYLEVYVPHGPTPKARYLMVARFLFERAIYSVDMSQLSNGIRGVEIVNLAPPTPDMGGNLTVHPSWILAAWSTFNGSSLPLNHTLANMFSNATLSLQECLLDLECTNEDNGIFSEWAVIGELALIQAASLIRYNYTNIGNGNGTSMELASDTSLDTTSSQNNPPNIIWSNFRRRVWQYGLGGRRTAYLGVVIVCIGMAVVVARTLIKVITWIEDKSTLELLLGALEYQPNGEFDNVPRKELYLSRVRFALDDDEKAEFGAKSQPSR